MANRKDIMPTEGHIPRIFPNYSFCSYFPNPLISSISSPAVVPTQNVLLAPRTPLISPLSLSPAAGAYFYPHLSLSHHSPLLSIASSISRPHVPFTISRASSTAHSSYERFGHSHLPPQHDAPSLTSTEASETAPRPSKRKKDFSIAALLSQDCEEEKGEPAKSLPVPTQPPAAPPAPSSSLRKRKKQSVDEEDTPKAAKCSKTSHPGEESLSLSLPHSISTEAAPVVPTSPSSTPTPDSGVFSASTSSSSTPSSIPSVTDVSCFTQQNARASASLARLLRHNQEKSAALNIISSDEDGDTCLHIAIASEKPELVSKYIHTLTTQKFRLDVKNHLRQTPLHVAVITNQPVIIRSLIAAGANVNVCDRNGDNCIHLACKWGDQQTMEAICESKNPEPALDALNFLGVAPIHVAAMHNNIQCVKVLVGNGAQKNIGDGTSGKTALHHAIEGKHYDLIRVLIQFDFDVNVPTFSGVTPLQFASGLQEQEIVSYLIHNGTLATKNIAAVQPQDKATSGNLKTTEPSNSAVTTTSCETHNPREL